VDIWAAYELYNHDSIGIDFNWGVEPEIWADPSHTRWAGQDKGMLVLDNEFDPAKEANQQAIVSFCFELG